MTSTDPTGAADRIDRARSAGRSARRRLVGADRVAATASIRDRLLDLVELQGGTDERTASVALYAPVDGEVDVSAIAPALRERGMTVSLPTVGSDEADIHFRDWRPGDRLVRGQFGVLEPPQDGRCPRTASELDVVVAPCTAVDEAGTRVGFGGGYYDRALGSASPRPAVVVVAFEAQVSRDPLPRRPWDVPADVVLTDARTFRPRD